MGRTEAARAETWGQRGSATAVVDVVDAAAADDDDATVRIGMCEFFWMNRGGE